MEIFSRKNIRIVSLILIIVFSLSCNYITNNGAKPTQKEPTKQGAEELVEIVTSTMTTTNTKNPPTQTPVLPTRTRKPTRTAVPASKTPPPTRTLTSAPVIRQSTQAVIPPTDTANPEGITVTAATGNLFIRRGPGLTYSIVAGLSRGVTTKAVGRNEKNDWLAIEIPYANGAVGWISMGTGYTELSANIQLLPLYKYDEAKPAYIQNCTLHDMTTRPGQWNLPAKTTQKVNPGEYAILDMSTGQSKVMDMVLKEGNTGIIKVDGDGTSHSCP